MTKRLGLADALRDTTSLPNERVLASQFWGGSTGRASAAQAAREISRFANVARTSGASQAPND